MAARACGIVVLLLTGVSTTLVVRARERDRHTAVVMLPKVTCRLREDPAPAERSDALAATVVAPSPVDEEERRRSHQLMLAIVRDAGHPEVLDGEGLPDPVDDSYHGLAWGLLGRGGSRIRLRANPPQLLYFTASDTRYPDEQAWPGGISAAAAEDIAFRFLSSHYAKHRTWHRTTEIRRVNRFRTWSIEYREVLPADSPRFANEVSFHIDLYGGSISEFSATDLDAEARVNLTAAQALLPAEKFWQWIHRDAGGANGRVVRVGLDVQPPFQGPATASWRVRYEAACTHEADLHGPKVEIHVNAENGSTGNWSH